MSLNALVFSFSLSVIIENIYLNHLETCVNTTTPIIVPIIIYIGDKSLQASLLTKSTEVLISF
jgi:hypothetical protein